ncbi:Ssl1-like-domain-containing protein [Pterulicium gracile]|uniref:General transcription and DNA repair factor IIH n=1 Tax=Pterulicium gracile TaxID=1884261 RepID=A0A5C3Q6V7_9AGAR|nr:Ssl1-like-domain-containing protein [Pterula gracilis]
MDVDSDDSDIEISSRNKGKGKATAKKPKAIRTEAISAQPYTWEENFARSWDTVTEDATGSLQTTVDDLQARSRRRRLLHPSGTALRRTIIRHLVLLLDLSAAMADRDMRPNRWGLTLEHARVFVAEWYDQNPLGQMAVVGMRAGLGERICSMTSSVQDVLKSISEKHKLEPSGEPSLQNAIEMARSAMSHLPSHASREILILFGSLTTVDPGNIHDTIDACAKAKIRISVVALAAEMKVCREMCERTSGQFGVVMNEGHYKDLLLELVPPPAQVGASSAGRIGGDAVSTAPKANLSADLLMMGFPTRLPHSAMAALCVCHSELKSEGFLCPRCLAKVCDVPTDCDVCGLMIVSSPHLARSYHHLFPVGAFTVVTTRAEAEADACFACARPFPPIATSGGAATGGGDGVSPYGRYRCPKCSREFCADCDLFVHEVIHCCPGCGK